MANIKGIIVEIGGDTSGLQNALKKVNSSTSSLSKELKGINSLLKLDPKNTELLSQKQTVLKENIEQTSKKLEELKKIEEMADKSIVEGGEISEENYRNLQREIINTQNKLNNLKVEASNWTKAGRSIEEFGNKVTNISNKIDKLGSTLTTRLTLPIAGIATGLISSAKEFETAFTGVEKTVDGTATQMSNLKQGIKDMAEEIPASTTEISAVAEAAGQLGIQTDNILTFTKTMINMGNATNLSADEAATTLARFANVTKMSQSDFNKLGSVIVALGNNFATTEAEITDMGMNLASAGTQVGMSQSQIMALATALSSVGSEAQAGGTAFSKVMVNMQLAVEKGGEDLKNFASVAGMTKQQFKKAFKEDATNAIMQFVDGLSKSGERGKSAIKILDDMGITETRLRDALLRSANASEVMSKAIELGNKAWEENTALTNEADKRYQTLDSRLQTTKNKILNVAINTGDKLTPSFNKLLDKVDGVIDKFDNLNEEEITNIIRTAALVAAIGPAIKIVGTFGKTIGTGINTVGTFSQAVRLMGKTSTEAFKNASEGTQILAKGLTFLISPAGLATAAITVTAGALVYFATKQTEAQRKARELAEEMANSKQSLEEYNQNIDKTTSANLVQIDSVSRLKDELATLVSENGKVKEGYKSRVSFILNELNKALGTEYSLNGDIVQSYKDLQNEISSTIEKKKAQIKLNAEEEKYKNAIEKQQEAIENLRKSQEEYQASAKKFFEEHFGEGTSYDQAFEKLKKGYMESGYTAEAASKYAKEWMDYNGGNLKKACEDAEWQVKEYTNNVKGYEEDYAKFTEGKYSEIGNLIKASTNDWTTKSLEEINKSIDEQGKAMQQYKQIYENTKNTVALQLSQQAQQNLDNLAQELVKRTQTLTELGPQEIEAWKRIASESYSSYSEEISKIAPEMQQKIQEATGVIAGGTPQMQEKAEELGRKTVEEFDKSADAKQKALNVITGYLQGLKDEQKGELLKQAGIENVDNVLKELNRGDLSEENGKNILEGLWNGLKNKTWRGKILGAASGLAQAVNKAFTGKDGWDEHSPSKKMKKFAEYYIQPISDVMNTRRKNIITTAQGLASGINDIFNEQMNIPQINDFGKLQGTLSREINSNTKYINNDNRNITFNIHGNNAKEIADEVEKIFGKKYT